MVSAKIEKVQKVKTLSLHKLSKIRLRKKCQRKSYGRVKEKIALKKAEQPWQG